MMKKIVLTCWLLVLLPGCQIKQHKVSINGQTFKVELADTDHKRAMGLMYREEMANDSGMLFIFPDSQPRAFWMKNTLIPLDIMYFDQNRRLVNIRANTPPCRNTTTRCPSYPSTAPAKYVLEINGGLSEKHGFKPGDELIIQLK